MEDLLLKLKLWFMLIIIFCLFSCEDNIVSECDVEISEKNLGAKFSEIQQNIFTPKCATSGCHVSSFTLPDLSAGQAYNNIVDVMSSNPPFPYVYPSRSDSSYLISKLRGINIQGSQMPPDRPQLTNATIDSIASWINQGALNN